MFPFTNVKFIKVSNKIGLWLCFLDTTFTTKFNDKDLKEITTPYSLTALNNKFNLKIDEFLIIL